MSCQKFGGPICFSPSHHLSWVWAICAKSETQKTTSAVKHPIFWAVSNLPHRYCCTTHPPWGVALQNSWRVGRKLCVFFAYSVSSHHLLAPTSMRPSLSPSFGFLKWGYPQIIRFRLGFPILNHPAIGVPQCFRKPPYQSILVII